MRIADAPQLAVPYCLHRAVRVQDAARGRPLALVRPVAEPTTLVVSGASPYRREDGRRLAEPVGSFAQLSGTSTAVPR